jgi:hypothetical protein
MSYRSAPSKGGLPSDEAMPLFLSEQDLADDEPPRRRPSFGRTRDEDDEPAPERVLREPISPFIIKAGIGAAVAATIIVGILAVGNPLALFANSKASLVGTVAAPPVQTAAQPASQQGAIPVRTTLEPVRVPEPVLAPTRSASPDQLAPEIPSSYGARSASPPSRSLTRDEMASAFKTARPAPPEAAPPAAATVAAIDPAAAAPLAAPPVGAAPPVRRIDPGELATLLKRARSLISIGDIAPARLLLKRAADAQEASAALLLAQTYDPAVLGRQDMRSVTPDPAAARDWYQKAARYGSVEAQQRLSQMQN